MDTSKFNKHDRALLEANPKATLEELRQLGMTETGIKKYETLLDSVDDEDEEDSEDEETDEVVVETPKTNTRPGKAKPQVSTEGAAAAGVQHLGTGAIPVRKLKQNRNGSVSKDGMVTVIGPSGVPVVMNARIARRTVKNNPGKFRIIS